MSALSGALFLALSTLGKSTISSVQVVLVLVQLKDARSPCHVAVLRVADRLQEVPVTLVNDQVHASRPYTLHVHPGLCRWLDQCVRPENVVFAQRMFCVAGA